MLISQRQALRETDRHATLGRKERGCATSRRGGAFFDLEAGANYTAKTDRTKGDRPWTYWSQHRIRSAVWS